MTAQQSFVLSSLEKVQPNRYKVEVQPPFSRWELDGRDCTNQLSALIARDVVTKHPSLWLVRTADLPGLERDQARSR